VVGNEEQPAYIPLHLIDTNGGFMWLRIFAGAILLVTLGVLPSSAQSKPPEERDNPAQVEKPVQVPTGVMLGRFEHKVMPVYPAEAMMKGIQGEVWFNIEVDETGRIVSAQAMKGDPLLIAASKEALEKSRFYPYVVNGTPVRVEAQLGFHFTAQKNGSSVSGTVDCITQGR
jgi:TonB family protein